MPKKRKKKKRSSSLQVASDFKRGSYPKGYASLLDYLNRSGKVQLTSVVELQTAKMLYVVKMMPPAKIAEKLQIDTDIIYRWKTIWDWDSDREAMEQRLYWQASKSLRKIAPDIDITHDRLAIKMESILERSMDRMLKSGAAELKDIKEISGALQAVISLRRVIKGKVTSKSERKIEHEHVFKVDQPHRMAEMERLVETHVKHPMKLIEETRDLEEVEDAEFEDVS